jgi:3-dehydroquinate synthase
LSRIKALDGTILEEVVLENVRIKAQIVEADEREKGLRGILNYGHTVGHAVEAVSNFRLKHGQAVAIGMIAAARISSRMGILAEGEIRRLEDIIGKAGLPTKMPDFDRADVLRAIKHDKKVRQDKVRFILLKSIGNAFISDDVDPEVVEEVLRGWD